jgi:hypothetical protein
LNPHCEAYETSKVAVPSLRMNFTALDRPAGIEPIPPRGRRGVLPTHPGPTDGPVALTGPSTSVDCQRTRSQERMAAAPGVEPGPASVGGSDAPVTPRCPRPRLGTFLKTHLPCDLARAFRAGLGPIKKAFQGIAPEGLVLYDYRTFRASGLRCYPANRSGSDASRARPWTRSPTRRRASGWPKGMAAPSMSPANWCNGSSLQTSADNVRTHSRLVNMEFASQRKKRRSAAAGGRRPAPPPSRPGSG